MTHASPCARYHTLSRPNFRSRHSSCCRVESQKHSKEVNTNQCNFFPRSIQSFFRTLQGFLCQQCLAYLMKSTHASCRCSARRFSASFLFLLTSSPLFPFSSPPLLSSPLVSSPLFLSSSTLFLLLLFSSNRFFLTYCRRTLIEKLEVNQKSFLWYAYNSALSTILSSLT